LAYLNHRQLLDRVPGAKPKDWMMVTLLDGGMGYELKLRGVAVPSHLDSIWSAQALLDDPETVIAVHVDYIEAGADVLTINNYAVTPQLLERARMAHRVEELTSLAIDLAEEACDVAGRRPTLAGSLPPLETSYRSDLTRGTQESLSSYRTIAAVMADRVDLLLCETLSSSGEAVCAATAAAETGQEYWVSWTLQGNRLGTLPSGESLSHAIESLEGLNPSAFLVNCCGANFVTDAVPALASLTDLPVGGYANAVNVVPGTLIKGPDPDAETRQGESATDLGPEEYSAEVLRWIELGASIVGGCCGTRPAHIKKIREILDS